MSAAQEELRRVQSGPSIGERPPGFLVTFEVKCRTSAEEVLLKLQTVMEIFLQTTGPPPPTDEEWKSRLPAWFVSRCPPEISPELARSLVEHRRQLPWTKQRALLEARAPWHLSDWLFKMQDDEREWRWWDARCPDAETIVLIAAFIDWPAGWGQLEWLLRAAGSVSIRESLA